MEISNGNIREDFFYRISTITITIPPLRKRREDLTTLIEFFLNKYQIEHDKKIHSIDKEVKDFLLNYNYPGNIRELKNIINRLVVLSEEGNLSKDNLNLISNNVYIDDKISIRPLREIRKEFECEYIEKVLSLCGNNISNTAKKLEISRRQLTNKISEYNIK
uniref:Two-component response regulator n=1 Tax=Clostridioides difficile TaxID=1496 RepID=A0A381IBC4_CLODI|nr:two-component response regulator [Clostridioides difficile]